MSGIQEIPGAEESYAALMDFVENGTIHELPSADFVPALTGDVEFQEQNDGSWLAGPVAISNPEYFKLLYDVSFPEGVTPVNENGEEVGFDFDFITFEVKHSIYGGEPFSLQVENAEALEAVDGSLVEFSATAKTPTDIEQYMTNDTGYGSKDPNHEKYDWHPTRPCSALACRRLSSVAKQL